jgi:hypothetical protein
MTTRLTIVAAVLLFGVACTDSAREQSDSGRGTVADNMRCLVPPPLAGLRLGDPVGSMRMALGRPVDSVRLANGRAGVLAITYRFPRADVRLVGGRVDRIVVTERGGWPRGLGVGSTRAEVEQYTGAHRLLRMTSGDTIEIAVCPDDRAFLHLAPAVGGQRVNRVELVAWGS